LSKISHNWIIVKAIANHLSNSINFSQFGTIWAVKALSSLVIFRDNAPQELHLFGIEQLSTPKPTEQEYNYEEV
jgi:hypothetical protein